MYKENIIVINASASIKIVSKQYVAAALEDM